MATVMVTDYLVLPDGCSPDDVDALSFGLVVHYCGTYRGKEGGGWGVFSGGPRGFALAKKARTWAYPPRFRVWQYRWENVEDALQAAREAVEDRTVGGRTYRQWQQRT